MFLFVENTYPQNMQYTGHHMQDFSRRTYSSSTSTITTESSLQSFGTRDSAGIFEDHPGLNPSSERIVELQSDIREKMEELMINRSPDYVTAAAERGKRQYPFS